jgi:AAA family ATP:ADP antiporter
MIRNWLFTLFYCMSELWGDVVLSLLFWGLANETTALKDASLLYPLFGIGANIGQACTKHGFYTAACAAKF